MQKVIYGYENWSGETPVKLGKLYVDQSRGSEHYAFAYDDYSLSKTGAPIREHSSKTEENRVTDGGTKAPRDSQRQMVAEPGSLDPQKGVFLSHHSIPPSSLTPSGLVFQCGAGLGSWSTGTIAVNLPEETGGVAPSLPTPALLMGVCGQSAQPSGLFLNLRTVRGSLLSGRFDLQTTDCL